MGCCSSSSPNADAIQNLKDNAEELQTLKGKEEQQRPASSTVMKDGTLLPSRSVTPRSETPEEAGRLHKKKSRRGKPGNLSVSNKQLRDPNMIVTTPMNGDQDAFPSGPRDPNTIVPPRQKQEAVAMFVSWEKPDVLGSKRKGKKGKGKGKRRSKAPKCAAKAKQQQTFIPGSGNEKILLADKSKTLTKLPPLKFKQVEANADLKSSIAADRKKLAKQKKAVSNMNKFFKTKVGFDDKICALIRGYAELGQAKKKEMEVMVAMPSNHSRTSYSCAPAKN